MSAVDEIQAATVKLTELRNLSDEGANRHEWKSTPLSPLIQADVIDSDGDVIAERCYAPDAELIVTLHRTIDAQLAILAEGLLDSGPGYVGDCAYPALALRLARDINGAT